MGKPRCPPPRTQRRPCAHLASPAPRSPGLSPERLWPAGFSVQSGPFVLVSSAHPRVGPANPLSPFSLTHWAGGSARRRSARGSEPTTRSGAGPVKALGHPLLPCAQAAEEAGSHQRQSRASRQPRRVLAHGREGTLASLGPRAVVLWSLCCPGRPEAQVQPCPRQPAGELSSVPSAAR